MKKEQHLNVSPPEGHVSTHDIEDAVNILKGLCSLASAAMGISRNRSEGWQSIDDLEQQIHLLQYLVDRMGWVADVALRKLGDKGLLARPEDWMMPDV